MNCMKQRSSACLPFGDYLLIAGLSILTLLLSWLVMSSPQFMLFGQIVTRVDTNQKVVALTLDDGPLPVHTDETLKLLAKNDVKATFFVIGKDAKKHSNELRSIVHAGHAVGNHGYTHTAMVFMSPGQVETEIEATDAVIRAAGYTGPIPFRAPYNYKFVQLPLYLALHNRPDISRDVIVEEGSDRGAEDIASEIVERVRPGSIILMHPMYDHTGSSRAAIPLLVSELKSRGYRFVTVPELLEYR